MPTDNFADIVSEGVSGIRIVKPVGDITGILTETATVCITYKVDSWQNTIAVPWEQVRDDEPLRPSPIAGVIENDVVRGIAEHELVQQCGREGCVQAGDQTYAGPFERGLNGWKATGERPKRNRRDRIP